MTRNELARKLAERTSECGLIYAIYELIGNGVYVEIGFTASMCAMSIDEINFSVRSMNALRRAGIFTIGDLIKALSGNELIKVRNLGKKSLNEIKTKTLAYGFDRLSPYDKQKFFEDLASRNSPKH